VTVHFVHVGKTGGTAIKRALTNRRLAYWKEERARVAPETPFGRIRLHKHSFTMSEVPPEDHVFFCVRDPIARFLSGFYSRLTKGQPRYYFEWTEAERKAFEAFPTPQELAAALASDDDDECRRAQSAMRHVRHLGFMDKTIGTPRLLRARHGQILFIARQETLSSDWEQLKSILELPRDAELPSDPVRSHRRDPSFDSTLDDDAVSALRDWYGRDYRLVNYCDQLRAWHGWDAGPETPAGADRLRRRARRLRGIPAVLPAPPPALRRRLPF
jgi:hypothetical protein